MGIFNKFTKKLDEKIDKLADNAADARLKDFKARDNPKVEVNRNNFKEMKKRAINNARSMDQASEVKKDLFRMERVDTYPSIWDKKGKTTGVLGGLKYGALAIPAYLAYQSFDSGTTAYQKRGTTSEKISAGLNAVDEDTAQFFGIVGLVGSAVGVGVNYGRLLELRGMAKMQKYLSEGV